MGSKRGEWVTREGNGDRYIPHTYEKFIWLLESALLLDSKKLSLVKQMECIDAMHNHIGMELGCK